MTEQQQKCLAVGTRLRSVLLALIYNIALEGRMEDGLWGEGYYERNYLYLS
ncbi:MAG: hypothetical protein K0R00_3003 [Herbinix sp.]|jgi:hypothetical protein|nr:hypothetical protein [Herbinix sp.]